MTVSGRVSAAVKLHIWFLFRSHVGMPVGEPTGSPGRCYVSFSNFRWTAGLLFKWSPTSHLHSTRYVMQHLQSK